jgi:hypothetical protein
VAFVESANLAVMWSYKAACTTVIKWLFQQNGLLPEALAYNSWVHKYRLRQYQKSERYLSRLKRLSSGGFEVVKIVRDPPGRSAHVSMPIATAMTTKQLPRSCSARWHAASAFRSASS